MKNSKSIIAIIALAIVATTVAFVSCKKEKQEQKSYNEEQSVQCSDNMDEYLISFKKKLLSAQKGEETISLEQAQRDLCNLLNFDFGDANYATNKLQRDTLYVPLSLTGGTVDLAQLAKSYNSAFAMILNTYDKIDIPEKSVLLISCHIKQKAKQDTANISLILTTRGFVEDDLKVSFDETDNWRVWEQLGKCDGTCVGDDHVSMLEKVYLNNRPILACENGRIYYSNPSGPHYLHADSFEEDNPNVYYNYHYRLWCGLGSEVISHCVEYPEMTYYYNNLCQILSNEAWRPLGHVVTGIDTCFLDHYLSIEPEYFYTFCCGYTTAKPNCTNVGPAY